MKYETQINTTTKKLKKEYYLTILTWVILALLNEFTTTPLSGILVENGKAIYILETITILVVAGSIPLALKTFSKTIEGLKSGSDIDLILNTYIRASRVRLSILSIAFLLAIITSYLCISSTGIYCAILIGFTAFFCSPTPSKLTLLIQSLEPQADEQE